MAKSSKKTAAAKADAKETKDPTAAPAAKAANKEAVAKTAVAKKAAARKKVTGADKIITAQMRHELVAQAAYLRSESQGFLGDADADWIAAEAEVDERLAKGGIKVRG